MCHKCTLLRDIICSWKKYQFGGMPKICCRYGIFTIKTLLNMRNNNNLPTLVAFVDIFKDFYTAGHELLIKVLEIYGDPPKFSLLFVECIKT